MQKSFLLVVIIIGVIDLYNFRDPKIIQYTIFDKRNDETEISFGGNYGGFIIGLQNF